MSKSLYITSTEAKSGKTAVVLGLTDLALRNAQKPGFFRPIINDGPEAVDDIALIASRFETRTPVEEMYALTWSKVMELMAQNRQQTVWSEIIRVYQNLEEKHDFILCEGTDFSSSSTTFEFDINAEIADMLGIPVLLVASADLKTPDQTLQSIELAHSSLSRKGCRIISTLINLVHPDKRDELVAYLKSAGRPVDNCSLCLLPYDDLLAAPTLQEIAESLKAEKLYGGDLFEEHVYHYLVAAMQLQNMLEHIQYGSLIIVPGDRVDVIIGCLAAVASRTMPYISGIILTGGFKPEGRVKQMIEGMKVTVPILSVPEETYRATKRISYTPSGIHPRDERKIIQALTLFEENVDSAKLAGRIFQSAPAGVSPKMFEYRLITKARARKQRIVLPEGEEERILLAAENLLSRKVVEITLLGNPDGVNAKISRLGLQMEGVQIINPLDSPLFDEYVALYQELRKHKVVTEEAVRDAMRDPALFGTMMVYRGEADGMVSGSINTTENTIRPALQVIKTRPGFTIVSSVFFMCLPGRVLVYGDCAIVTEPTAEQLAEIALSSAATARAFGIEPKVAMLSYSSGHSGKGADVEKVRRATRLAQELAVRLDPGLVIEGPMQYDAAVDPGVARIKMPESRIAGNASVLIFPDLDTGNITYKAVQRSAGVVAIGPILQGLKKPVNDLSRGCSVPDIINTVAITAIQAQAARDAAS